MVQGATPTFICTLPDTIDLTEAEHVCFTVSQTISHVETIIEKLDEELTITAHTVEAYLTQAETLELTQNVRAKIQVNWTYSDGSRGCTNIVTTNVSENLHKAVIQ